MDFPKTPKTIIELLIDPEPFTTWNGAWRKFFDLYHAAIKVMVNNSFYRRGWYNVPEHVIDEVIEDTVISLNRVFNEKRFDPRKSRFRFFLKTICDRRVVDFLRRNGAIQTASIDDDFGQVLAEAETAAANDQALRFSEEEQYAFRQALLLDTYMSIRHNFDARTCVAFEMVKLEDVPIETVVRELGVSPNTINNAVYRITKRLKAVLAENENLKEAF